MNLLSNCSRLIEPCVRPICSPGFSTASAPPGASARYLPPSRLSLVITAELSVGSRIALPTVNDTTAW